MKPTTKNFSYRKTFFCFLTLLAIYDFSVAQPAYVLPSNSPNAWYVTSNTVVGLNTAQINGTSPHGGLNIYASAYWDGTNAGF